MDEGSSYLLAETKRRDPDRYLCALFAPADRRDSVLALVLFNDELARIPIVVTQPMTGLIRLQWWRDALDELAAGGGRGGTPWSRRWPTCWLRGTRHPMPCTP